MDWSADRHLVGRNLFRICHDHADSQRSLYLRTHLRRHSLRLCHPHRKSCRRDADRHRLCDRNSDSDRYGDSDVHRDRYSYAYGHCYEYGHCDRNIDGDRDHNIDADRIANVKENCEGKYIKVAAENDGSFTLTNQRTGVQKTYAAKK